jgi:hypothetical protein
VPSANLVPPVRLGKKAKIASVFGLFRAISMKAVQTTMEIAEADYDIYVGIQEFRQTA